MGPSELEVENFSEELERRLGGRNLKLHSGSQSKTSRRQTKHGIPDNAARRRGSQHCKVPCIVDYASQRLVKCDKLKFLTLRALHECNYTV